jgi:heptosyltransferase-1
MLTGRALGYEPQAQFEFGLDRASIARRARNDYAVLIHGTARVGKEWPQSHWLTLARALVDRGLDVVLPWGSAAERRRSEEIAAALGCGEVPDRRPLDEVAALIAGAAVVSGSTQGSSVAAALRRAAGRHFTAASPAWAAGPLGGSSPWSAAGFAERVGGVAGVDQVAGGAGRDVPGTL